MNTEELMEMIARYGDSRSAAASDKMLANVTLSPCKTVKLMQLTREHVAKSSALLSEIETELKKLEAKK